MTKWLADGSPRILPNYRRGNSIAEKGADTPLPAAIGEMLEHFSGNKWFEMDYWPANKPRVVRLLKDLQRVVPCGAAVFEPGCGSGYISFLASRLGYRVTATDSWQPQNRERLFQRSDVRFFRSNLNDLNPWPDLTAASFDAVLFGEVFEHLLNHPIGVLEEIRRILRPGGVLLLTTPNPSTLANAVRVLTDSHSLWGTEDFARTPKIVSGKIIDKGDIHYREYRAIELRRFLSFAKFQVDVCGYVGFGSPYQEPRLRRSTKFLLRSLGLTNHRLFAGCNYIVATKA